MRHKNYVDVNFQINKLEEILFLSYIKTVVSAGNWVNWLSEHAQNRIEVKYIANELMLKFISCKIPLHLNTLAICFTTFREWAIT